MTTERDDRLQPVSFGHEQIRDEQIESMLPEKVQPAPAVNRAVHLVAGAPQDLPDGHAHSLFIIDQEDLLRSVTALRQLH